MEGDVVGAVADALFAKALGLYAVVAVAVGLIGLAALSVRAYAQRVVGEIERKLARLQTVEEQLAQLLAGLPLHYQRRDDAIREYTAMNAKLDRLWEALASLREAGHGR